MLSAFTTGETSRYTSNLNAIRVQLTSAVINIYFNSQRNPCDLSIRSATVNKVPVGAIMQKAKPMVSEIVEKRITATSRRSEPPGCFVVFVEPYLK